MPLMGPREPTMCPAGLATKRSALEERPWKSQPSARDVKETRRSRTETTSSTSPAGEIALKISVGPQPVASLPIVRHLQATFRTDYADRASCRRHDARPFSGVASRRSIQSRGVFALRSEIMFNDNNTGDRWCFALTASTRAGPGQGDESRLGEHPLRVVSHCGHDR